jgi:23S rRNA (guanosine2251-2'-O)-methyltransferase
MNASSNVLAGLHPVREALRAGRKIEQVQIQQGQNDRRMSEILDLCRSAGVAVHRAPRPALDRLAAGAVHQGVVAITGGFAYADVDDVVERLSIHSEGPGLLVVLDGVEDPHNLGAIVRTAYAAGADAVIIPERRAAGITPVAAKAAAGALEHLPVCRVTNIARTLEQLKEKGYWATGLSSAPSRRSSPPDSRESDAPGQEVKSFREIDYRGGCIIVLGAEGAGLHRLVREKCDWIASIPMAGALGSLNVSVAAGIVLYEAQRQRSAARRLSAGD